MRSRLIAALLCLLTFPIVLFASSPDVLNDLRRLHDGKGGVCAEAAEALRAAGMDALHVFDENFSDLDSMAQHLFCTEVIPNLPAAETHELLLEWLRETLPLADQINELSRREQAGEDVRALEAQFAPLMMTYLKLRWTLQALAQLGMADEYDLVQTAYLNDLHVSDLHRELVRTMYALSPQRAMADFDSFARSDNPDKRAKGLWSYQQARYAPPCETVRPYFNDQHENVREAAHQLIYLLDRECLDLLIELSGDQYERFRWGADTQLCRFGHIAAARLTEMMANADSPAQRREVWSIWWSNHRNDTDEALRALGLREASACAAQHLDTELIRFLTAYPDSPDFYDVLRRALASPDARLQQQAVWSLSGLARSGSQRAVEFLVTYCSENPPATSAPLLEALADVDDVRVVPLLLDLLAKAASTDSRAVGSIIRALGKASDQRATEPLIHWILESPDGSDSGAADALAQLNGANDLPPRLLQLLVKEENQNRRSALRRAIAKIGGATLPAQLTAILPDAPPGDGYFTGPLCDVLELMAQYPDAAAKPLLLEIINGDNLVAHPYAARVLAKLGDYAGVTALLNDLAAEHGPRHTAASSRITYALKDIAAPGTSARLIELFNQARGEDRYRILEVIRHQVSLEYFPFLERLLGHNDDTISGSAAVGIALLIHHQTNGGKDTLDEIGPAELDAVKQMLLWAIKDRRPQAGDREFPDRGSYSEFNEVYLKFGFYRRALYKAADDSLVWLDNRVQSNETAFDDLGRRRDESVGRGFVTLLRYDRYLEVTLHMSQVSMSYLFYWEGGEWNPVCCLGGSIS